MTQRLDVTQALEPGQARRVLNEAIQNGVVRFTQHCRRALADDKKTTVDATNVLRAGRISFPEWENGQNRYRVTTDKMGVAIAFEQDEAVIVVVVTAWEIKK